MGVNQDLRVILKGVLDEALDGVLDNALGGVSYGVLDGVSSGVPGSGLSLWCGGVRVWGVGVLGAIRDLGWSRLSVTGLTR